MQPGTMTLESVLEAGEVAGGLSLLSGDVSYFDVRCRTPHARVALIDNKDFTTILGQRPRIILPVAHSVVFRISPFLRAIDFALDWESCESGKALFLQGQPALFLYVVLSGRFRSVLVSDSGERKLVEEHGKGDMLGVLEVFHKKTHSTDMIAIRHSTVAKIHIGCLDYIKVRFPQVLARMLQLMGQGLSAYQQRMAGGLESMPNVRNLHTVAILPVNFEVPYTAFSHELTKALGEIKPTLRLSSSTVATTLNNPHIFDVKDDYRLIHYLNRMEDTYEMIVYVCDSDGTGSERSFWTDRCLKQADCILIVAMGDAEPSIGAVEKHLEASEGEEGSRAQKELILLWPEECTSPSRTADWLDLRTWVSNHYHIRCPKYMFKYKTTHEVSLFYERREAEYRHERTDPISDFARLGRLLTGNSIGLVLGGGGARGASHVGVLRAIQEYGIPVDCVAGVSIGSFMGGLYCDSPRKWEQIKSRAVRWFRSMNWFNFACDWTPLSKSSTLTGSQFNTSLRNIFEDKNIEDLWLPYFCLSTDITSSQMKIHRQGLCLFNCGFSPISQCPDAAICHH